VAISLIGRSVLPLGNINGSGRSVLPLGNINGSRRSMLPLAISPSQINKTCMYGVTADSNIQIFV